MARDESIIDRAIDWHLRQAELRDDEWPVFIEWLEADAAHAQAYDQVATLDRGIAAARIVPAAANDDAAPLRRWPQWLGAAAVAATVAAVALPLMRPATDASQHFATRAGERRTVALADGSKIELSGGTRISVASAGGRMVELEQGQVTLHVRHDAANPFSVKAGGVTLRDLGTVFDVARVGQRLDVQVAEGSVLFQPGREALTLAAGDALVVREDTHVITRHRVAPEAVGGWRAGMLTFNNEPMTHVVAAVQRLRGVTITLDERLSHRPFTGMVRLTGASERDIPHLAALIGADARRDGGNWIITERTIASR